MRKAAIERVESRFLVKERPDIHVGDTVDVGVQITEGDKQRVQVFTGTVIARRGTGATETFTVRRIVAGEGVERTFPLHSPHLAFVRVVRSGRVHRAKLYYLRERVGKATRLAERRREVGTVTYAAAEPEAEIPEEPAPEEAETPEAAENGAEGTS
jgi:large subunit ribosomal protein L19